MKAVFVVDKNRDLFVPPYNVDPVLKGDVCIGAIDESNDTACAYMTAELMPMDIIRIKYIFVHEDFRLRGAGSCMMDLLKRLAARFGIVALEFRMEYPDEPDEGLKRFLDRSGFSNMKLMDVQMFEVRIRDLKDVKSKKFSGHIETIRELSGRSWDRYADLMETFFPWRSAVDEDLSYIVSDESMNPIGALFASRNKKGLRLISFKTVGDNAGIAAEALYGYSISRAKKLLPEDAVIIVEAPDKKRVHVLSELSGVKPKPIGIVEYLTCNIRKTDVKK